MIAALAVACVFAGVWALFLPPPTTLRLTSIMRTGSVDDATGRASTPRLADRLSRVRDLLSGGRRGVTARRAAVIELCDGIAAELTAGRPPGTALTGAAEGLASIPRLEPVLAAARSGDDVAASLERAAVAPGCEGLRLLAGCWRIGTDRGGMLASVVEGLAEALRDEQTHREEVAMQLAGPRTTARLLAGLPLLGMGMAVALGARPFAFLFGTLPGGLCLALGTGLDALGLWWTRRLATAAEELR
ncbi:type II secretion system F family protein [Actinoallomurus soli]|uniref:type II secretion system F family protein n=1 Tax=Actinoallomurus soli TaxID=2952535 RepID=UPI002091F81D|nr:type II secretion system F family protein [Actinoallomurus soli]MCO5970047.1 type II secretion system F family protein [Actinoallomurus soli]